MSLEKGREEVIQKTTKLTVVGIGASAGGQEAMAELLKNLPADNGMAYVYVQHLDPTHESNLAAIFRRVTKMEVTEAVDEVVLQGNHLYIIPPNKEMTLLNGAVKLGQRPNLGSSNMPINKFFSSLAEKFQEASIGVILSGAANDGTMGLKSIKLAGGLTFAQDDSAKFQSMPKSAVAEGAVDLVLSPKEMAEELTRIAKQKELYYAAMNDVEELATTRDEEVQNILIYLYKAIGVDFRQYKMNTIRRRIIRRMMLHKYETLKEYSQYIKQNAKEINLLYQDLLINVTTFFRDESASEYLRKTLLPAIVKEKSPNEPIRIWVPACSTGQEVYSIAMLLFEVLGNKAGATPIQIFATDLSEAAINKARLGVYSKSDVADVPPDRLQAFFTKPDGHYRIIKSIRDVCIFATHNIAKDPPFSRLDLVSCCNLLIYLDSALQKRVFDIFHYSLNPNGYLVLGASEAVGSSSNLFSIIDKKNKIYAKKKDAVTRAMFEMNYRLPSIEGINLPASRAGGDERKNSEQAMEKSVDKLLLKRYTPASVVVNNDLDIVQFRGPIGMFLEPSPGRASLNLLKMARAGLGFELRNVVHKAKKSGESARKDGLEIMHENKKMPISIEAIPLKGEDIETDYFLVVFEETPQLQIDDALSARDNRVKQLEGELTALREDMRAIIESQEAANEELQSANEEIISSNEELQSINEELETSKEEIESSNEELITINQELQERNEQLTEMQEYSEAVFSIMRESLLILDKDLRVKNANKAFYKTFKVSEDETLGRLLYELGEKQWNINKLRHLLEEVIPENDPVIDYEVSNNFDGIGKKVMLVNASRITQSIHGDHLILMAIEDVTEIAGGGRFRGMK